MKSCVSPTGPDHSKNRETVYLDHCHQTGPEARGTEMTIKCPKCGTQLPVGFGNLGRLGGWTLGSTNVEGGLHSPFESSLGLTRSPKIINCYVHSHRNLYWFRGITSAYGQRCSRASSNLWASSTDLFGSKTRQPLETYSRSEQTKPFGDHQWVTSIDFKDIYFHIPIQEQSRKCLRFLIPAFRFVHSTLGVHRDPKGGEIDGHTQGFKKPPVPR